MIINLTFNSEDKSLEVTKDGERIDQNLSDLHFYALNEEYTKFELSMTEIKRMENGKIDHVQNTRAAFAKAVFGD